MELFERVLKMCPQAAKIRRTVDGRTPLLMGMASSHYHANYFFTPKLLESFPGAAWMSDSRVVELKVLPGVRDYYKVTLLPAGDGLDYAIAAYNDCTLGLDWLYDEDALESEFYNKFEYDGVVSSNLAFLDREESTFNPEVSDKGCFDNLLRLLWTMRRKEKHGAHGRSFGRGSSSDCCPCSSSSFAPV